MLVLLHGCIEVKLAEISLEVASIWHVLVFIILELVIVEIVAEF